MGETLRNPIRERRPMQLCVRLKPPVNSFSHLSLRNKYKLIKSTLLLWGWLSGVDTKNGVFKVKQSEFRKSNVQDQKIRNQQEKRGRERKKKKKKRRNTSS